MAADTDVPWAKRFLDGLQRNFKVVLLTGVALTVFLFVGLLSFVAWTYAKSENIAGLDFGSEPNREQQLFIPTKDFLLSLNRQTDVYQSSLQAARMPSFSSHRSSVSHRTDIGKQGDPSMQLYIVHAGLLSGGVCLDGSPPAYYLRPGKDVGASRWIVHFNGGAWCFDEKACLERSHTSLGSSRHLPKSPPIIQGVNSADPQINPDFYDWNLVWVVYCDGASFTGDRENPVNVDGELVYFRGRRALDVILDDLMFRGFDKAERVILTGSSAGSMTAMFQADYIASKFGKATPVHVLSDAGFFIETASLGGKSISALFSKIHNMQNSSSGLNQNCVRALGSANSWQCFLPEVSFKYIRTPTFVLNAAYDVWALIYFMGINCKFPTVSYSRAKRSIDRLLPLLSSYGLNGDETASKRKRDISGFEMAPFFRNPSNSRHVSAPHEKWPKVEEQTAAKKHDLIAPAAQLTDVDPDDNLENDPVPFTEHDDFLTQPNKDAESRDRVEHPGIIDNDFTELLRAKAHHVANGRMRTNPDIKIIAEEEPQLMHVPIATPQRHKLPPTQRPRSNHTNVAPPAKTSKPSGIDRNRSRVYHRTLPSNAIKNKRSMSIAREYISILRSDPPECTDSDMVDVMKYREAMIHATRAVSTSPRAGIFLVSCIDHSLSLFDETWTSIIVNGKTIAQAFGDWYYSRPTGHHDLDCPYPCNPSCP